MRMRSLLAAAVLTAAAGSPSSSAASPFALFDAAAWLAAAFEFGEVALVPVTLRDPVFRDDFGSYTDPAEPVFVPAVDGFSFEADWRSRAGGFVAPVLGPATVAVHFGCASPVHPCLGVKGFEAIFDRPVLGFGGAFTWHIGYGPPDVPRERPIDVAGTVLTWDSPLAPAEGGDARLRHGFLGLIGSMEALRIAWLVDAPDDFAWVRWTAPFAVVRVPEPAALALFVAALAGLAAAARVVRR